MKTLHIFGAKNPRAHPNQIVEHVAGPMTVDEAGAFLRDPKNYEKWGTLQRAQVRLIGRRVLDPKSVDRPASPPIDARKQVEAMKDGPMKKRSLERLKAKEKAEAILKSAESVQSPVPSKKTARNA